MRSNYQRTANIAAALFTAALLSSCGGDSPDPAQTDTSEKVIVTVPMQQERSGEFNPENVEAFHEVVFREYARAAVELPKRTMDSIMRSTSPIKIEEVMTRFMQGQDTIARAKLAAKYNISTDSLDAIIELKNRASRDTTGGKAVTGDKQ